MRFFIMLCCLVTASIGYCQNYKSNSHPNTNTIRGILTQELMSEQTRLAQAQIRLAREQNRPSSAKQTAEEIERCQENIRALKRELAYASKRGQLDAQMALSTDIKQMDFKTPKASITQRQDTSVNKKYVAYTVTEQALNSRIVHWYVEK